MIKQLLCTLLFATTVFADTGIDFANDFFVPGQFDRWLSNEFRIYQGDFAIGGEMYTPRNKRNPGIPVNDRPWDGYTYGEYTTHFSEDRTLAFRIGALGAASQQDELQKFVHNNLGRGIDPKGWPTQNPSELALEGIYTHHLYNVFDSYLGTVRSDTSYGLRAGNVQDLAFVDVDLRRGWLQPGYSVFGIAGLRGEARAFNTHLQGRMFHDDTYTVDMIPFVASTWLGFGATYGKWDLEFVYTYVTDETKLQDYERHLYGTVTIKRTM